MASSSQPETTDTRQRLVAVATSEFAQRGYDGASLRQVCAAAGVTTGALYFLFDSKEDLFRTVVAPLVDPLRALLSDAAAPRCLLLGEDVGQDGEAEGVPGSVRDFLELCYERDDVRAVMMSNSGCSVMRDIFDELAQIIAEGIGGYLRVGTEACGSWDEFAVGLLARAVLSSLMGILAYDGSLEEACRHAQEMREFISAGIEALGCPAAREG